LIGALILAVGLFVTIITYNRAASSENGGTYLITGAPILIGVASLYYGMQNLLWAQI
jgi:ABC-type arginine/histidine transport system permease subunit